MERKRRKFSLIRGYAFEFECQGHRIDAWFSAFSGLEKVFVDGLLVAKQRNYNKHSRSTFSVGNAACSTSLDAESLLKGPFVCTLYKDGEPFKRQRLVFPTSTESKKKFWYELGFFVAIGLFFGLIESYFALPSWYFWVFIGLVVAAIIFWNRGKSEKPYLEEEECV